MAESKRTLVREILVTQLIFAAVVGLIAIGCVTWVSNWVVRDNLDDWSVRWIGEMEGLGTSFFVDSSDDRFLQLEGYLTRFPEIEYVRYYDLNGETAYLESRAQNPRLYPSLAAAGIEQLRSLVKAEQRYRMDAEQAPVVRISQAVARESIVSANLFNAQSLAELESEATVVGFVELGLDYSAYDRDLLTGISTGSVFILIAFLALMLAGRILLRRALQPLSDMLRPLDRIANGDLEVEVPASDHREIAAVGGALQTAVEKIRERDRHLTKLANFDPLTGLPSRYHFVEQLGQQLKASCKDGGPGALMFLDLDQFKYVNDTLGHQAGDEALNQVAQRLRHLVRRGDLIGRFGGDEFVLFIPDVSEGDAEAVAQKLLVDLSEFPLVCRGESLNANCSLGIAMVDDTSVLNPEELISQADVACRQAKHQGRNRARFYERDEQHIESIRNDVEWQRKLKEALRSDTLELRFQPIVRLSDDQVRHYEVLVRMREGGKVYLPNQFLPAAIRFGLMGEVDRWVIDRALAQLAGIRAARPKLRFAINVAGSAFADGSLADFVKSKLKAHGVPARSVLFEITEQVAVGSFSEAVPQIRELKAIGCEFAVDDFGTGYNSLSYLKRLPVQYIKIDGSFIQRLAVNRVDQAIVRSIADIARIMGKKTVAEFVGDEQTLQLIRDMGIDFAQGYYVGKPVEWREVEPVEEAEPNAKVVPLPRKRRAR